MATEPRVPTPWHLWFIGGVGLLWNSVGAFDFVMMRIENASYMARLTPVQLDVLLNLPSWLVLSWAVAVWGGVIGSLLVLVRKALAVHVLLVSLVAMSVTGLHNFASDGGLYATSGTSAAFVLLIFSFALGLWLYALAMERRGD